MLIMNTKISPALETMFKEKKEPQLGLAVQVGHPSHHHHCRNTPSAFCRTHLKSSHLCRKSYNSYFTKFQRNLHNHLHQSGFGAACMESKTIHLSKAEPTIPEGLYCKKFFLMSAGDGYEAPRKCTSIHC